MFAPLDKLTQRTLGDCSPLVLFVLCTVCYVMSTALSVTMIVLLATGHSFAVLGFWPVAVALHFVGLYFQRQFKARAEEKLVVLETETYKFLPNEGDDEP